jgi:hypothetical protein
MSTSRSTSRSTSSSISRVPRTSIAAFLALALALPACGTADSLAPGPAEATPPGASGASAKDAGATAQDAQAGPHDAGSLDAHDAGTATDSGAPIDAGVTHPRKRGIAYGHHSDADLSALSSGISSGISPGIGWWYNWSLKPESMLVQAHPGVDFVPMIWGKTFDATTLAKDVPQGAKYLLTFNEPNFGAQSNITPEEAAALWPKIEAFASTRGMAIVSPALNYCAGDCNATTPFDWLDRFFAACANCKVDYIAAHWYACTKSALSNYLQQYESKYHKPIWLTEFSCLDDATITEAKEEQYMRDAVALLEADPMVFRYAWFTGRFAQQPAIDTLGATSGALTPLGKQYVTLPEGP